MWQIVRNRDLKQSHVLPDIRLGGSSVTLRPAQFNDHQSWVKVRQFNENRLRPLEPTWPLSVFDPAYFEKRLQLQARDWYEDKAYTFFIFKNTHQTLIGGMNLNFVCRGAAQYASLGYWVDAREEGKGYMTEAGFLIIEYAFDVLKLKRLNAACLPENDRSCSLLKRLKFEEEGFAKGFVQINGQRRDHKLFGLCAPGSAR